MPISEFSANKSTIAPQPPLGQRIRLAPESGIDPNSPAQNVWYRASIRNAAITDVLYDVAASAIGAAGRRRVIQIKSAPNRTLAMTPSDASAAKLPATPCFPYPHPSTISMYVMGIQKAEFNKQKMVAANGLRRPMVSKVIAIDV